MPPLRNNNVNANPKPGRANPLARTQSYGKGMDANPFYDPPDPSMPKARKGTQSLARLRGVASPTTPTPSMRLGRRPDQAKPAPRKRVLFLSPRAQHWAGPTPHGEVSSTTRQFSVNLGLLHSSNPESSYSSAGHTQAGYSTSSEVDSDTQSQSSTSALAGTRSGPFCAVGTLTPIRDNIGDPMSSGHSGHQAFYSPLSSRADIRKTIKAFTPAPTRVKLEERSPVIPGAYQAAGDSGENLSRINSMAPHCGASSEGLGSPFNLNWPSLQVFDNEDLAEMQGMFNKSYTFIAYSPSSDKDTECSYIGRVGSSEVGSDDEQVFAPAPRLTLGARSAGNSQDSFCESGSESLSSDNGKERQWFPGSMNSDSGDQGSPDSYYGGVYTQVQCFFLSPQVASGLAIRKDSPQGSQIQEERDSRLSASNSPRSAYETPSNFGVVLTGFRADYPESVVASSPGPVASLAYPSPTPAHPSTNINHSEADESDSSETESESSEIKPDSATDHSKNEHPRKNGRREAAAYNKALSLFKFKREPTFLPLSLTGDGTDRLSLAEFSGVSGSVLLSQG
ncbi:hypothetical protein EST38_g11519 [Candolleomyces aberdarensis]|uniref:Uncharacterized protein n=1 Tax=Candolleomyces aberdarensis TaxID=2316362 RepID=A0A4Q2D6Z7_9AGAR|nr:hypothetical protein EST38_g11519 [Candolleomyces aberdarensis]